MKIKFNKFERIAGIFVLVAIGGTALTAISVAIKQGWFETKVRYSSIFENADGVHPGTLVQMAGLKAGSVESVELQPDNKIRLNYYVLGKFEDRVTEESEAQLIRPFIIGDRVLEVTVGSNHSKKLDQNAMVKTTETLDLMTLISGKKLNSFVGQITGAMESIKSLMEAFLSKNRTESMVRMFDRLDPLLRNMNVMSLEVAKLTGQITEGDHLRKVLKNVIALTNEMNVMLPEIKKENPKMAQELGHIISNLNTMTTDFKVLGTAVNEIGPELPQATRRALEALNETVVILKAMQKSFVLKGNVDDVRQEEKAAHQRGAPEKRLPAGTTPTPDFDKSSSP